MIVKSHHDMLIKRADMALGRGLYPGNERIQKLKAD